MDSNFSVVGSLTVGGLSGPMTVADGGVWTVTPTGTLEFNAGGAPPPINADSSNSYISNAGQVIRSGNGTQTVQLPIYNMGKVWVGVSTQLNITGGNTTTQVYGIYQYSGRIRLDYASTLGAPNGLYVNGGDVLSINTTATINVGSGNAGFTLNQGSLNICVSFENTPSPLSFGTLTINGDFNVNNGTVNFKVVKDDEGVVHSDLIACSGTITLLNEVATPTASVLFTDQSGMGWKQGDTATLMTAGNISGDFGNENWSPDWSRTNDGTSYYLTYNTGAPKGP
jgi:hypothetical protein